MVLPTSRDGWEVTSRGSWSQAFDDFLHVIDAAAPGPSRGVLESGPEPCVSGKTGIRLKTGMGFPLEEFLQIACEIGCADQFAGIDVNPDRIPVPEFPERTSGEGLR